MISSAFIVCCVAESCLAGYCPAPPHSQSMPYTFTIEQQHTPWPTASQPFCINKIKWISLLFFFSHSHFFSERNLNINHNAPYKRCLTDTNFILQFRRQRGLDETKDREREIDR